MSARTASRLAWSLAALAVAMFGAAVVLYVLTPSDNSPGDWFSVRALSDALGFVAFLAFPLVGALIASRRPDNPIGWICLADGLLWMVLAVTDQYSIYGLASPGSVPFPVAVGTIGNQWLWVSTVGLLGIYLLLLFPNGRLPSSRWRPLAWFAGVVIFVSSIVEGFSPGPLENQGGVPNPFGLEELPWLSEVSLVLLPLLPLCILASAFSLVLRYSRSGGEIRQQIKWVAFIASFTGLLYLIAMVSQLIALQGQMDHSGKLALPLWFEILFSLAVLGFAGVPVAIGFAVLKYRLYDIDLVINRTLVYGSLTATLLALYLAGVSSAQTILRLLTGQEHQPQLAIVASTLVIAALFNPLRRRIQSFIDRRFYRSNYDARKTLEEFSTRLRKETDLEALSAELVGVVIDTMQPERVSLWLRPEASPKSEEAD
ncbi:MAG TPA: hypothetical protein VHM69_19220 [Rubrobacter sp.]|nr:hypothetical protein [Rubrobacter sp.]